MMPKRHAIIRIMVSLGVIAVMLGVSIAVSAFVIPHSASYVKQHEIDWMQDLAGAYPLSVNEPRFRKFISSFETNPRSIDSARTSVLATIAMFDDLGYSSTFEIPRRTLISFILHVKEGYKDVPYHNWMHGFTAGNFAYLLIKELSLNKLLGDHQAMAVLIACLCHDLGHPGTSANFQRLTNSDITRTFQPPALLEKYHLEKTKKLLQIHENDILAKLNTTQQAELFNVIEQVILATDLGSHLDRFSEVRHLAETGFNDEDQHHVKLLLGIIATASDLNDHTKSFANARESAYLLCKEFYAQGVREEKMGHEPEVWMNPSKAYVIKDQLNFVKDVARPVFEVLHQMFPTSSGLMHCVLAVQENYERWSAFQAAFEASTTQRTGVNLDILKDPQLVKYAAERFKDSAIRTKDNTPPVIQRPPRGLVRTPTTRTTTRTTKYHHYQ